MKRTDKHLSGVVGVISLARNVNPEIGDYEEHFTNEMRFIALLSNGRIEVPKDIAKAFEAHPSSATPDKVEQVLQTFRQF